MLTFFVLSTIHSCLLGGRIACTMDVGSTKAGYAFAALSAHYVNSEFKMCETLLKISEFPNPHTGLRIFDKLVEDVKECFPQYSHLQNYCLKAAVSCVTRDCVSANNVAMRLTSGILDM